MTAPLAPADAELLEFERHFAQYPKTPRAQAAKEHAILTRFNDTPTRYHQRLAVVIDKPEALPYDPQLVARLRERRDQRAASRAAGTFPAQAGPR